MAERDEPIPEVAVDDEAPEFEASDEEPETLRQRLDADFLLDKVIPGEIDWRDVVRRHPVAAVGIAAAFGFLIGRARGAAIVAGASAAVTTAVMRQLSDVLDGEIFEF
jgi:hypothetical protein